jgi:predicted nucleotidyltransferase
MFFGRPFGGLLPGATGAVLSVLLRTGSPLTGRQVHGLVRGQYSLWSVQEALKTLAQLGVVDTQTIGRAGVHAINEGHSAVPHLRALADPLAALTAAVEEVVDSDVACVIIFGSIARGEATEDSDIDLAVVAHATWDGRIDLQENVRRRLGNHCDVLVFTQAAFKKLARAGEPVVQEILRDGVALVGTMPRLKARAA